MWNDDRYAESPELHLWKAVRKGDAAEVQRLLAHPRGSPNLECRFEEETFLHLAIRNKEYAIAEALLKAGADVNAPTGYTAFTPFVVACDTGDRQAIDLLVKYKADVNARTAFGETGLHRAAWRGDNALIAHLAEDLGCDVNAQSEMGQTALFCAVSSNFPETIKTLISLGADADIEGSIGSGQITPRAFAGGMEQRQEVAATLDDPSLKAAWINKTYQPVTKKPVTVGKPLTFKMKPPDAQFSRLG